MIARNLPSFSPGNPFHHDSLSTGIRLKDAVVIDEEFEAQKPYADLYIMFSSPRLGSGLYIYNSKTGERLQIIP